MEEGGKITLFYEGGGGWGMSKNEGEEQEKAGSHSRK